MIKEDFCSFEVAKLLKEKGFDETCYACYEYFSSSVTMYSGWPFEYKGEVVNNSKDRIKCPTHQMAMKWLREEHDIFIDVGYDDLDFYWLIESIAADVPIQNRPKLLKNGTACHRTYEQAVESAIKYCLENLI